MTIDEPSGTMAQDAFDRDFDNEVPLQLEYPDLMQANPKSVKVNFKVNKFIEQEIELLISSLLEINKNVLPFIAEQVKLTGTASSAMGWRTVRVDLDNLVLKN